MKQISNSDFKAVCRFLSVSAPIVRKNASNLREENIARMMSRLVKKLEKNNG